jgi:hypothetical protein
MENLPPGTGSNILILIWHMNTSLAQDGFLAPNIGLNLSDLINPVL